MKNRNRALTVILAALLLFSTVLISACPYMEKIDTDSHTQPSNEKSPTEATDIIPDFRQAPSEEASPNPIVAYSAKVTRVIDGDTIEVSLNGIPEKVRLIGIDTPESVHPDASRNVPYGKIASDYTKTQLLSQYVDIELDVEKRDQYGRLLAYIYKDGIMFNKLLIEEGHASVSTYPPNVKYVDDFITAQKNAREEGKGIWSSDVDRYQPSDSKPNAAKYIGTTRSFKFHTFTCKWGRKITSNNEVFFETRDEAIDAGFTPCKVCRP
jgi:micrococcal nuclease